MAIDRDSCELRRIVKYAIKLASQTNWDSVQYDGGTELVEDLTTEYAETAIREAK
jgi:hypothetical protein